MEFLIKKLPEVREISPNAAIFRSLLSSKRDKPASGYDTVTAKKNEDSLLPELLTSLFDYNATNMEGVLLQEFAVEKFSDYESCLNQDMTESQKLQYQRVCQMCGYYIEYVELLHQISIMPSIQNLAKVKLYLTLATCAFQKVVLK